MTLPRYAQKKTPAPTKSPRTPVIRPFWLNNTTSSDSASRWERGTLPIGVLAVVGIHRSWNWACYFFFLKGVFCGSWMILVKRGRSYSLNAFCFWHLNDFYVLAPDALDEGNLASNSSLHLLCKCMNPMVAGRSGSILSQMYRDNLCFCPCLPHLFPNRSKQIFAKGVGFNDVCSLLFPPWSKLKMDVQSAITHHWGINLELNQKTDTKSAPWHIVRHISGS